MAINTDGFFMKDGSGLSPRNGVTAKTMAQIMRNLDANKVKFNVFYNLLAIAGKSATLQHRCKIH